jgi:hypothetical protein
MRASGWAEFAAPGRIPEGTFFMGENHNGVKSRYVAIGAPRFCDSKL